MRKVIFLILFLTNSSSWGQINLVFNGNLENYSECPAQYDEITFCNGWTSLDSSWRAPDWGHDRSGVPEYCNVCSTAGTFGVPRGCMYFQYAHSGAGMAQVMMYHNFEFTAYDRDYLQGHFTQTLFAGHSYFVSFNTAAEDLTASVNNIGAYIDDGTIDSTNMPFRTQWQYHPQILDTSIISDTLNWKQISGVYTANGTEKYITIGNFFKSVDTRVHLGVDTTGCMCDIWMCYLIDDVSVIDCATLPFAGNDTLIHPGDSAFLGTHEGLIPWVWYVLGSSTPIDSGGGLWVHPTATTKYVVTQDICGDGIKSDTITVHVWPDTPTVVKPIIIDPIDVNVYPNPSTSVVTIDGGRGCTLEIYNAVGQVVLRKESLAKRDVIDVSELEVGDYLAVVVNPVSGVRVVRRVGRR